MSDQLSIASNAVDDASCRPKPPIATPFIMKKKGSEFGERGWR